MVTFDDIIIGSGQAGNPLAAALSKKGRSVALIEKSRLGGSCVNSGCTPTKAYVASARRAFIAKHSGQLGVKSDQVSVNLQKIKERKDSIISDSRKGIRSMFRNHDSLTLKKGVAKFLDDKVIEVNGEKLKAERVFINCGARARIPDGFAKVPFLTNKTILELEEIPEHLIIIGGGPVGIEFGQIFSRFGSKVSLLEMNDELLGHEDDDIAEEVTTILKQEGIDMYLGSECIEGKKSKEGIEVAYRCEDRNEGIQGSHLLLAAGRIPNTDTLDLQHTQVELDDRGYIKVNDYCETSVNEIYALGDCNGEGAFTHTSYNDFQIVEDHLYGNSDRKISDRISCYAIYMDPPLARVGMNEVEIKDKGIKAQMAKISMQKVARAKEMGETQGMMKAYIDSETNQFLGASFIGVGADEYIHTIADQMYAESSFEVIRDAVHIHPTISELIPTMLENLQDLG